MALSTFFCFSCYDEKEVRLVEQDMKIPVRGEDINVSGQIYLCTDCGHKVSEPNLDNENLMLAYREYRRKHHLLQPKEISEIRAKYGLSQRAMARLLGWGQITIQRYERGSLQDVTHDRLLVEMKDPRFVLRLLESPASQLSEVEKRTLLRKVNSEQAFSLEKHALNSLEEYLTQDEPGEYTGFKRPDLDKLAKMALFYGHRLEGYLFKVKLMKLLFYSDFLHFRHHGVSISGFPYAAIAVGPVPDRFQSVLAWLEQSGNARFDEIQMNTWVGEAMIPLLPFHSDDFGAEEIDAMEKVLRQLGPLSGTELRELSHREPAWLNTEQTHRISYHWARELKALK